MPTVPAVGRFLVIHVTDLPIYGQRSKQKGLRVDWYHELLASLIWLGEAFLVSVLGLAIAALTLSRYSAGGANFSESARPISVRRAACCLGGTSARATATN